MSNDEPSQSVQLLSRADYVTSLDTICSLSKKSLFVFDKNFIDIGFNSEARFEILREFLLSSHNNTLQLLAVDTKPVSQYCPRLMTLLRQFGHNMFMYQLPKHLQHLTEPFAVTDDLHYVRRYHFDDPRGICAQHDESVAHLLKSRFLEMWQASRPSPFISIFSL